MAAPDTPRSSPASLNPDAAARLLRALRDDDLRDYQPTTSLSIDGYIISHELEGGGGGGTVFLAYRVGQDRPLALKVIGNRAPGLSPSSALDANHRAWRELDISMLRLDCLPRVIDHGAIGDGRLYIAYEFIEGSSPLDYCQDGDLDTPDRVRLLVGIADAVQTLHDRGILHRDIKPSNIIVTPEGRPMILDLGIATVQDDAALSTLTEVGRPIGTLAFMSPEQARGERSQITVRSDVYSIGATAFQLLTGHTPHDMSGAFHEALLRIVHEPPRDPLTLRTTIPRPLSAVLSKACALNSGDRYASAREFADDLRRWLNNEPVEASPRSVWRRATRWAEKRPRLTTIFACLLIATATLGLTALSVWWANRQPARVHVDGPFVRLYAISGKVLHEWGDGSKYGYNDAVFMRRPREMGGGSVVVLGLKTESTRALCCFDAAHPTRLLWSVGESLDDFIIPPYPTIGKIPATFEVGFIEVKDVFAESEGKEIIATFNHTRYGISVVRIYTPAGQQLFEVWHRGHIFYTHWLPEPRVLGLNGYNSEALWKCRGQPTAKHQSPLIVSAIRPERGTHGQWLTTPTMPGQFQPLWYRGIFPPDPVPEGSGLLISLGPSRQPVHPEHSHFVLNVAYTGLILDTHGRVVDTIIYATGEQDPNAGVSAIQGGITLGDLPPIDPDCGMNTIP